MDRLFIAGRRKLRLFGSNDGRFVFFAVESSVCVKIDDALEDIPEAEEIVDENENLIFPVEEEEEDLKEQPHYYA